MTSTLPHVLYLIFIFLLFLSIQVGDHLYFVLAVFFLLLCPGGVERGLAICPCLSVCLPPQQTLSFCFCFFFFPQGVDFVSLNTFLESVYLVEDC